MKKNNLKPCSIKWMKSFLKKEGFKPITEERMKADPSLREACKKHRT